MHPNELLITKFYSAFQNKDYDTMQSCYAENARFSDSVFVNLNASEVKAMWEMLCKNGKDLVLEFSDIQTNDTEGKARWVARYTFSRSGKKVVNRIEARFKFKEGLIVEHIDSFSFYGWASQAMGLSGMLLGWTPFFKEKVRHMAMQSLKKFMGLI